MRFQLEDTIQAPRDVVWGVFTDLESAPDVLDGIERLEVLTDGPFGRGTRFRETRVMFKKEATEEMEITAADPPSSYTVEADSCGAHFSSTYRFEERDGATHMTFTVTTRPLTFVAKLMSPLGFLMAGAMKKAMQKDHDQLKARCEELASAGAPS